MPPAAPDTGLVRRLVEGPLDLVGDVHGEADALDALLERLGYRPDGRHPDDRHLVFVGDLVDRGPDSPGVVRRVRRLLEAGRTQLVLGNHEMNLLRGKGRHGNHWIRPERHPEHERTFGPTVHATAAEAADLAAFFDTQPLALERADLRVVHAAWSDPAVDRLRTFAGSAREAHEIFEAEAMDSDTGRVLKAAHRAERAAHRPRLEQTAVTPPFLPAVAAYGSYRQNANPVRVLTSGVEVPTEVPFHAGGEWRFVSRAPWWRDYAGPPVVVGHFWRWWHPSAHAVLSKGEPPLHWGRTASDWARNRDGHEVAFCVDFSVGARWKERQGGYRRPYHGRLAALRWPERTLVFDGPDPLDGPALAA